MELNHRPHAYQACALTKLSYRPFPLAAFVILWPVFINPSKLNSDYLTNPSYASFKKGGDPAAGSPTATLLRLHPNYQPYLRCLPPLRVSLTTSGTTNSHGVTGGVYKARERIHRGMLIHDY